MLLQAMNSILYLRLSVYISIPGSSKELGQQRVVHQGFGISSENALGSGHLDQVAMPAFRAGHQQPKYDCE